MAARTVRELTQDPQVAGPARSALAAYDDAVRALVDPPPLRELRLLHPRDHRTAVGHLSVRQRRRLAPAVVIAASPDLLLLDEPTNHVSLALAGELEQALAISPGGIVVALARALAAPALGGTGTGGGGMAGRSRRAPRGRGHDAVVTSPRW